MADSSPAFIHPVTYGITGDIAYRACVSRRDKADGAGLVLLYAIPSWCREWRTEATSGHVPNL